MMFQVVGRFYRRKLIPLKKLNRYSRSIKFKTDDKNMCKIHWINGWKSHPLNMSFVFFSIGIGLARILPPITIENYGKWFLFV